MGHVHVSKVKFRHPVPDAFSKRKSNHLSQASIETEETITALRDSQTDLKNSQHLDSPVWISSTIPGDWIWQLSNEFGTPSDLYTHHVKRQTVCALEADTSVDDILNQQFKLYTSLSQSGSEVKMVQSLIPIWEEEYERTGTDEVAMPPDPGKPLPRDVLNALSHKLNKRLEKLTCKAQDNKMLVKNTVEDLPLETVSVNEEKMVELDTEALGLLKWLATSQAAEEINSDDELVRETILSPLLPTTNIDKVLERASTDYESESQRECQDILDSIEDFVKCDESKVKLPYSLELNRCSSSEEKMSKVNALHSPASAPSKLSSKTQKRGASETYSGRKELQISHTSLTNKRKKSLWGTLPFSVTKTSSDISKIHSISDLSGGDNNPEKALRRCSDVSLRNSEANVQAQALDECSVRDLMRKKRSNQTALQKCPLLGIGEGFLERVHEGVGTPLTKQLDSQIQPNENEEHNKSSVRRPDASLLVPKKLENSQPDIGNPIVVDSDSPSMQHASNSVKQVPTGFQFQSETKNCEKYMCRGETSEVIASELFNSISVSSAKWLNKDTTPSNQRPNQMKAKAVGSSCLRVSPIESEDAGSTKGGTPMGNSFEQCADKVISKEKLADTTCFLSEAVCSARSKRGNFGVSAHGSSAFTALNIETKPTDLYRMTVRKKPPVPDWKDGPLEIASFSLALSGAPSIVKEKKDGISVDELLPSLKIVIRTRQEISLIGIRMLIKKLQTYSSQPNGISGSASIGAGQQLTLLSLEVQAESRGDLRPDPRFDAVNIVVLAFQDDNDCASEVYVLLRSDCESSQGHSVGIPAHKVLVFFEEKLLFNELINLVRMFDPDVLMGWDIQSGSIGFLAERAAHLGLGFLKSISRTPFQTEQDADTEAANKGLMDIALHESSTADNELMGDAVIEDEWGRTHASGVHVVGRIVLNVWRLVRSEVKLNMYTIEAVSEAVLRRKTPSIPFRVLTRWFASGPGGGRYRCIEFVMQRANLNFEIVEQLDMVNRTSELARVFGIDFFSVLSRGSQYRVESMLLRLAHTQNYIAISPGSQQVASQPAMECLPLVMEPESGFYADPVVVLDFQSLYPSMIIAYNLCFCTCLGNAEPSKADTLGVTSFSPDPEIFQNLVNQLLCTPNSVMYAPSEVRKGILPRLLEEILSTRIMVKKAMKKLGPNQQILHRIFNARQLALKLIANVTYGYTAAGFSGRMPCAELADSIVQCGRSTLEKAIALVNANDNWKARVVYGDTDSMFVLLKGRTVPEAFRIGNEIAAAVSAMNPYPVTLKMEKVYHPCFLLTKKRYVGYSYERPDQSEPIFDAKGIETVRRDSCAAVSKLMERSIRHFFEHQDISKVKVYLYRQWTRILSGRVSLQDFIFAKEVRLGSYSTRPSSSLPPAAIVATKAMRSDPRAEPRYAERVPYVVIHGQPGGRLVDMVVDPLDLLALGSPYRLNDIYYITKQIIPALQRVFGLVGADLNRWFAEMPRPAREASTKRPVFGSSSNPHRTRIDYYYLSQHCLICGDLVRSSAHVCGKCLQDEAAATTAVVGRTSKLEREMHHLAAICRHCGGGDWVVETGVKCTSLACSVFYERRKVQKELMGLSAIAAEKGLAYRKEGLDSYNPFGLAQSNWTWSDAFLCNFPFSNLRTFLLSSAVPFSRAKIMARTQVRLLLWRRLKPYSFARLSSSPSTLIPYSTSSAAASSPDPPKPSSLSARMSFVFDQIDAIERERSEKHETLQKIRAWRQSKTDNQQLQNQERREEPSSRKPEVVVTTFSSSRDEESDAGYGFDGSSSGSGVELGKARRQVELVHPWPEWIELMERLVQQNYFDHKRSKEEDQMVESLGIDDGFEDVNAAVEKNQIGVDFAKDFRTVQNAFVNFGKDRFDILRSLPRKDLQLLVGYGCPTADRRVVMSAKLLRKRVHLDEGDVCSSCSLRSSCEKAFLLTNKEEEAHTIDAMRVLLAYGFDPTNGSVTNKSILKEKSVKTVVRKLLHEIVKLSAVPIDPNLPPPVIKKPPPKVKQPPPPPKKRVGRDDIEMKKGDWLCPKCDFMNFAKNTACLQCDAKRPKRQLLPGEWECAQCNFLNYRRNMVCFHCDCKRPHDDFLENRMEERNRDQKPRFEKVATRPEVSNAWNFDFDDDESDGADVAAFENADSALKDHEPPMSAAPAQGGNFRDREMGTRNPSKYSDSQPSRSGTGFDDFDDEDDIESYELDTNPTRATHSNASRRPYESEDIDLSDDDLDSRPHSRPLRDSRPTKPVRRKPFADDDELGFDSDEELSSHSKWKSSHVASGHKNRGRSPAKKLSFGSDDDDLDLDSDDDSDEEFGGRKMRTKGRNSTRGGFQRRGDDDDDYTGGRGGRSKRMGGGRRESSWDDDFDQPRSSSFHGSRGRARGNGGGWRKSDGGRGRGRGGGGGEDFGRGRGARQGGNRSFQQSRSGDYGMMDKGSMDDGEYRNKRRVIERRNNGRLFPQTDEVKAVA
ncbi:unnamed protein product [Linum tenue]|uniref:DNA polymerase zeta catalytic subunit n=1 Tax=Linum tenue TaxID=586396 RepID=A0AAV0R0K4_9ROSI|nr:unnamed protein product [Linum tenue]